MSESTIDNTIKTKKKSSDILYFLQFGLYFFSFLFTESMVNERAAEVIGPESVNMIYAGGFLCTALGYFTFWLIYAKTKKEPVTALCISTIVFAVLTAQIQGHALYLIVAYLCLISFGYLGGYVHYRVSLFSGMQHFSLCMGLVMASAIVLQFIVQSVAESKQVFVVSIFLSSALFMWMKLRDERENRTTDCEFDSKYIDDRKGAELEQAPETRRKILMIAVIVALMSMILGMEDSIMVYKNAAGELRLYSGVRLFYAFGLIAAGYTADLKDRILLPAATVCAVMLSTVVITFLNGNTVSYNLSMAVMYFYCGFYVIYLTLMFMDAARLGQKDRLIAGMGRIVRSVTTAIVVLLMTAAGNSLSYIVCNTINCILSILVIAVFAVDELYRKKDDNELGENKPVIKELSSEEKYERFCEQYQFTEKEKESFMLLISTEDTVQAIADNMGISRRVLQRHIASMYEKTGTQTRVGLLMVYARYLES